jgi:glycosyltransferase involved in cell wall biosynthesis
MKRPHILFVSPRFPHPLNSGAKIRIYHLLRAFADFGDVDFVCYAEPKEFRWLEAHTDALPDWWQGLRSILIFPVPDWPIANLQHYRRLAMRRPFASTDHFYDSFPMEALLARTANMAKQADLIWAERLYVARAFLPYGHKTIVDLDDLESVKIAREAVTGGAGYGRFALQLEARRLAHTERQAVHQFAAVAVCSPEDTQHFGSLASKVWTLPNGVDDTLIDRAEEGRLPNHLVFVGTMNYWPNEQAMLYFHDEILPRIRTRIPDVVLSIVGLKPPASIRNLHDGRRVFVHADVPEVAPYVQRATLSIVPLRVGGGTRLKILESLALGTPVVSTKVGAEGLDLEQGRHLLLADEPGLFADEVVRLLTDPALRQRMADEGRERVRELYLWSAIRKQVQDRCMVLLASSTPA